MGIEVLTDSALADNIRRYEEKGVTEGGHYSLADLRLERLRRVKSPLPYVKVAEKIIELAAQSEDGLTTYLELWKEFRPGEKFVGFNSQQIVAKSLARVVEYCVRHNLPILTVLVVREDERVLSLEAVANICRDAADLGVVIGPDPEAFISRERERARAIVRADLPAESVNDAAA